MKFIDEAHIIVSSGNGGPGSVSFRRESHVPRGGPDGGDGGKGGDVLFKSTPRMSSLLDLRFKKKYPAQHGGRGGSSNSFGKDGDNLVLKVPPGTIIRDRETREILADLSGEEEVCILKGGRGGKGNSFFKSSVNQAPQRAQPGETGETRELSLELKLIADVGIIGMPSAGKSTLISHISAAKPKVADYPFTTLVPNLGVVKVDEGATFVVADTPGLILDAHKGVGLGIQFLKHIERCRVFIHMVDASGISGVEPLQAYQDIRGELKKYDEDRSDLPGYEELHTRSEVVALNKMDTISKDRKEELVAEFKEHGIKVICVSAATGQNLKSLVSAAADIVFVEEEVHEEEIF